MVHIWNSGSLLCHLDGASGRLVFRWWCSCAGGSFRWSFGSVPLRVSRGEYTFLCVRFGWRALPHYSVVRWRIQVCQVISTQIWHKSAEYLSISPIKGSYDFSWEFDEEFKTLCNSVREPNQMLWLKNNDKYLFTLCQEARRRASSSDSPSRRIERCRRFSGCSYSRAMLLTSGYLILVHILELLWNLLVYKTHRGIFITNYTCDVY